MTVVSKDTWFVQIDDDNDDDDVLVSDDNARVDDDDVLFDERDGWRNDIFWIKQSFQNWIDNLIVFSLFCFI